MSFLLQGKLCREMTFFTDMFIIVRMKNKQTGAEDRMNQNEKKK